MHSARRPLGSPTLQHCHGAKSNCIGRSRRIPRIPCDWTWAVFVCQRRVWSPGRTMNQPDCGRLCGVYWKPSVDWVLCGEITCSVGCMYTVHCLQSCMLRCQGVAFLHRARINNAFFLITGPLLSILLSSISSLRIPSTGRANIVHCREEQGIN